MNTTPTWIFFLNQIVTQLPLLLVYIGGLVFCAMRWRRAPSAAMLALIGTSLTLLATVAASFLQAYVVNNRFGGPTAKFANTLTIIYVASAILRGLGFALVLIAVFAQREPEVRGFEVAMTSPAPDG